MTGMWPTGAHDHHQHPPHVAGGGGVGYAYPMEMYGHPAAGAAGYGGWSVAQAAAQQHYGAGGGSPAVPPHMLPGGHMSQGVPPHMMASMPPGAVGYPGMQQQQHGGGGGGGRGAGGGAMMQQHWVSPPGQPLHLPMMVQQQPQHQGGSGSPPLGGYGQPHGGNSRGSWGAPGGQKAGGAGGGGFGARGIMPNGRPYGGGGGGGAGRQQDGRGGGVRGRRNMMLNTNAGDFSDAAVEAFAAAVKRTPPGQAVDANVLADGLTNLDSRGLAALLKDLAKNHHSKRAREVFDYLRALPAEHPLAPLCDVFTYTAMVSLCVDNQELPRAFELLSEMKRRGVECNVHTYTALMNVAIKSGQLQQALEIYQDMLQQGCPPNVVTYNTLIDVYGKTGQWGEALRVIKTMHASNTKPVTRTYNTLMIACNTSGQWQEALNVYDDMVRRGHQPNTTTYNALISAYSKAGRLEKVMEVYQEMLRTGCERSVITYSALISACEKAGHWQLALNLFNEMQRERCTPNVITYNSLITACAQGAQWSKAADMFQQMQAKNCRPDVVTYTALVTAYERGGQWMRALEAFRQMQRQAGCHADAILYNTLLDVLWDTGVPWAQHQAGQLFRVAVEEGHFRRLPLPSAATATSQQQQQQQGGGGGAAASGDDDACGEACLPAGSRGGSAAGTPTAAAAAASSSSSSATPGGGGSSSGGALKLELGMQGVSPGVAMLMLHCWLADLRAAVVQQPSCLPERLLVSAGRSRQRDHISSLLRDSTLALLTSWRSPFAVCSGGGGGDGGGSSGNNGGGNGNGGGSKLEAPGGAVAQWLQQEHMARLLAGFARQPGTAAAAPQKKGGNSSGSGGGGGSAAAAAAAAAVKDVTAELEVEAALEKRCQEAFAAVKDFENSHCLSVQAMGGAWMAARAGLVARLLAAGEQLHLRDDVVHDAVLLMDRAMSASFKVGDGAFASLAAACLHHVASAATDLPDAPPSLTHACGALGCEEGAGEAGRLLQDLKATLKDDLSSISALRCLKLYLERLGCVFAPDGVCSSSAEDNQDTLALVARAAGDAEFLNYRPTITAAAALYCERLHRGKLPFWPSCLSGLTGYSNARTPELSAAIGGAQRLWKALLGERQLVTRGATGADAGSGAPAVPGETATAAAAAAGGEAGGGAEAQEEGGGKKEEKEEEGQQQVTSSACGAASREEGAAAAAGAEEAVAVDEVAAQLAAAKV